MTTEKINNMAEEKRPIYSWQIDDVGIIYKCTIKDYTIYSTSYGKTVYKVEIPNSLTNKMITYSLTVDDFTHVYESDPFAIFSFDNIDNEEIVLRFKTFFKQKIAHYNIDISKCNQKISYCTNILDGIQSSNTINNINTGCEFCQSHEKGDILYEGSDWDGGGLGFDDINIKYCPMCGRELKEKRRKD